MQHRLRGAAQLALEVGAVVDAHVVGVGVLHIVHGGVEAQCRRLAPSPLLARGRGRARFRARDRDRVRVRVRVRVQVRLRVQVQVRARARARLRGRVRVRVRVQVRLRLQDQVGVGVRCDQAAAAHLAVLTYLLNSRTYARTYVLTYLVEARAVGGGDEVHDGAVVVDGPPLLGGQLVQCTCLGAEVGYGQG